MPVKQHQGCGYMHHRNQLKKTCVYIIWYILYRRNILRSMAYLSMWAESYQESRLDQVRNYWLPSSSSWYPFHSMVLLIHGQTFFVCSGTLKLASNIWRVSALTLQGFQECLWWDDEAGFHIKCLSAVNFGTFNGAMKFAMTATDQVKGMRLPFSTF